MLLVEACSDAIGGGLPRCYWLIFAAMLLVGFCSDAIGGFVPRFYWLAYFYIYSGLQPIS
jgi:hypothetical protein